MRAYSFTSYSPPWRVYWTLCKPRVVALMLLTVVIGMLLATPSFPPLKKSVLGLLGIALSAGAAAAINQWIEQHQDALMARTQYRPLPARQVTGAHVLIFAAILGVSGLTLLVSYVNFLTAALTFASLIGYAAIYTAYLKHTTPQNIVIGGLAGAAPPLLGWTAITGQLDPHALLLVLIIFVWTPPHFWALAIDRRDEYAKAGFPMLPVTHGIPFTKKCIFLYTVLLTGASLLPFATGMSGLVYLIGACLLDGIFLWHTWWLWQERTTTRFAMRVFRYSITYLMLLFLVLLVDHYL